MDVVFGILKLLKMGSFDVLNLLAGAKSDLGGCRDQSTNIKRGFTVVLHVYLTLIGSPQTDAMTKGRKSRTVSISRNNSACPTSW